MLQIAFANPGFAWRLNRQVFNEAWQRVMASGQWILGPELEQFEQEFATYCGARACVGVGNGLDALFLALTALGIGAGDEVIVPAHTFVATWLAVTRTGATPVAAEPAPGGFLVNAEGVDRRMSSRTRAVIAVHLYGSVAGIEDIAALCQQKNLLLVEDAAQAHGAQSAVAKAGNHGVAGCFSFYPSKNLGAFGDAGAVVCNDRALEKKLRSLRNYGSAERYQHEDAGVNSRLDELQAAILRVQLGLLDAGNARRQQLAGLYLSQLSGIVNLQLPEPGAPGSHVWHLFVVRTALRDALENHLLQHGCETLIHYPKPVYRFAPFESFAPAGETAADRLTAEILSLPMGPHLSNEDVSQVCDLIQVFFREHDDAA